MCNAPEPYKMHEDTRETADREQRRRVGRHTRRNNEPLPANDDGQVVGDSRQRLLLPTTLRLSLLFLAKCKSRQITKSWRRLQPAEVAWTNNEDVLHSRMQHVAHERSNSSNQFSIFYIAIFMSQFRFIVRNILILIFLLIFVCPFYIILLDVTFLKTICNNNSLAHPWRGKFKHVVRLNSPQVKLSSTIQVMATSANIPIRFSTRLQ